MIVLKTELANVVVDIIALADTETQVATASHTLDINYAHFILLPGKN